VRDRSPAYRAQRRAKGQKIIAILQDFLGSSLSETSVLDVGCSIGEIDGLLLPKVPFLLGMDVDFGSLDIARQSYPRLSLVQASGERLPFADQSWDLLICAQVYEHVDDQEGLFSELWRVLSPGGVCFFSGPNRLWPVEEHYHLPLLSWLPRTWADSYMRWAGKGEVYEWRPLTYWRLRRLLAGFILIDYTIPLVRHPERYGLRIPPLMRGLPRFLIRLLRPFLPNYNWILIKPSGKGRD
jgi:SAM-dependent methyltransferase